MISLISPSKLLQNFVEGYLIIEGNSKQIFGGNDYTLDFSDTAGFFFNCGDNCYKIDTDNCKNIKMPKSGFYGIYTEKTSYSFGENIKLIFVLLKPDTKLINLQISEKELINSYVTIDEAFGSKFKAIENQVIQCSKLEERLNVIEKMLFETIYTSQKKNESDELICILLQKVCPIQKVMC